MSERVELDLLADYAAGLLDGTPEADEIARLVAADPAVGRAYAELAEADQRVRADLDAMRASAGPMPMDVVARVDAALREARRPDRVADGPTVVSLEQARRRRRRRRWAAAAAAAAGVVAFALFGLPALRGMDGEPSTTLADRYAGSEAQSSVAGAPAGAPAESAVLVRSSGTDYTRETLRTLDALQAPAGGRDLAESATALGAPDELGRLRDPAAREACLAAIAAAFAGRPVSVDYARFEGVPALVVLLVDARAAPSRVVAAGAGCGLPSAGADVRYTSTLG